MKEHAFLFGSSQGLVGIVTEPSSRSQNAGLGVVFRNAGVIHRVGPCRLYVTLARELANLGCVVARFDHSGVGDSHVRRDGLPFEESSIAEAREAMDWLQRSRGVDRFVLAGLCSGAVTSFDAAVLDLPLKTASATMAALLEARIKELAPALATVDPLLDRVRRALSQMLDEKRTDVDELAKRLGTSKRSLQRSLGDLNTTHSEMLDRLRKHLDFRAALLCVVQCRIGDAVYVALFHVVVIDDDKFAHPEAHKLLDHRTTGAGCTDDRD